MGYKYRDLSGEQFGKLTVIKRTEKPEWYKGKQRCLWWLCKCSCGKEVTVYSRRLVSGEKTHCGCSSKEYWEHNCYKGCGKLAHSHWSHIVYSATVSRDYEFNLTIEDGWELFQKQNGKCFYTGDDLILGVRNSKGGITASLDRLDNTKGYTKDNVVWCRKDVNIMKMAKTYEDFIECCRKIARNHKRPTSSSKIEKKPEKPKE